MFIIYLVKAHDGDRGINNAIRYSIAHGGDAHFAIDEKTGLVYTTKALDREDSRNQENGAYILEIVATERSKLRVIHCYKLISFSQMKHLCYIYSHNRPCPRKSQ